jgi:hypothetical protein
MCLDIIKGKFSANVEVARECFLCSFAWFKEILDANFVDTVNLVRGSQCLDLMVTSHWKYLGLRVNGFEAFAKGFEKSDLRGGVCDIRSGAFPIYCKSMIEVRGLYLRS